MVDFILRLELSDGNKIDYDLFQNGYEFDKIIGDESVMDLGFYVTVNGKLEEIKMDNKVKNGLIEMINDRDIDELDHLFTKLDNNGHNLKSDIEYIFKLFSDMMNKYNNYTLFGIVNAMLDDEIKLCSIQDIYPNKQPSDFVLKTNKGYEYNTILIILVDCMGYDLMIDFIKDYSDLLEKYFDGKKLMKMLLKKYDGNTLKQKLGLDKDEKLSKNIFDYMSLYDLIERKIIEEDELRETIDQQKIVENMFLNTGRLFIEGTYMLFIVE